MESTMNHNVKSKYHKREERYRKFFEKVNVKVRKLVLFNLIIVFGGLGIFLPLCFLHYYYLGAGVLIAFLVTYIFLNSRHDKALYYQALGTAFIDSNRRGFQRLSGEWTTFTDSGEDLAQSDHFYAEDRTSWDKVLFSMHQFLCDSTWQTKAKGTVVYSSGRPETDKEKTGVGM